MVNQEKKGELKIVVIGTGLIGCSMAEGLRDIAGEIIGVDNDAGHLQEALDRGWIDRSMSLEKALGEAGVVIMAVPSDSAIKLLPYVLDRISRRSAVLDTGSVKVDICRSVRDHPRRDQFVAAHPMAGLAVAGPDASDSRLFMNRKVIICESDKSSAESLDTASAIFNKLGMGIILMKPDIHDLYVAKVSHLPQVIAYCLSLIAGRAEDKNEPMINIASTGFESSTRLASSPSNMWIPIFQHNSDNLTESLNEMIGELSGVRDMINDGDWQALEKLIEKANRSREDFLSVYKKH